MLRFLCWKPNSGGDLESKIANSQRIQLRDDQRLDTGRLLAAQLQAYDLAGEGPQAGTAHRSRRRLGGLGKTRDPFSNFIFCFTSITPRTAWWPLSIVRERKLQKPKHGQTGPIINLPGQWISIGLRLQATSDSTIHPKYYQRSMASMVSR
jgi:hypothetical protein